MRPVWQFFNGYRHFCHWWQKFDGQRLSAMAIALILLALILVMIVTARAVRLDGYGNTAPPPTFEQAPDHQRSPIPRLLP